MGEYKFSKNDIIQDDFSPLENVESKQKESEDSDKSLKTENKNNEHYIIYDENQNKLYDLCSFSMLGLCIFEMLYCLFVNYNLYNYNIITYVGVTAIVLFFYSNSLKFDKNSRFSNFANEYLTFDCAKSSILFIFKIITRTLSFLAFIYPVSAVLLWLLSITNIISIETIQKLPYCYHPNCNGFSMFIIGFAYAVVSSKLITEKQFGLGSIVGAILLYTFFDQKLFDAFANIASVIAILAIILIFMWGFLKGAVEAIKNTDFQEDNSYSNSSENTSSNYNTDLSFNQKEEKMIGSAIQEGSIVKVYDTNGNYLFTRMGELNGYTANSVSIKNGHVAEIYDAKGNYKYSRMCD